MILCYAITEPTNWAITGVTVDEEVTGSAYALLVAGYNLGLVVLPYIFGYVKERFDSYRYALYVLCGLYAFGAFMFSLVAIIMFVQFLIKQIKGVNQRDKPLLEAPDDVVVNWKQDVRFCHLVWWNFYYGLFILSFFFVV